MDLRLEARARLRCSPARRAAISLATAEGLAREGAGVFVHGRSRERVETAREPILEAVPLDWTAFAPRIFLFADSATDES